MNEAPSRIRAALLPSADVDAIAEVIYKIATGAISSGPHQSGIPGLCWYRMAGAPVEAIKKLLSPRDPSIVKMTISKTGFSLADIQLGMLKEELVRALLERPDHNFPSVDIAMGYKTAIHHLLEDKPSIAI
ncbi:MAG: hypothetical protein K0Q74_968 [Gammaproteobacteria bacterium]|nr:hypothetical protein [Gammaproteobacteria bacterium]